MTVDPLTLGEFLDDMQRLVSQLRESRHPESMVLHQNLHIELRGPDGELLDERRLHNLICTAGKNTILAHTAAETLSQYSFVGIGTGTTAAAIGDTALQTESARSPAVSGSTVTNPTAAQLQIQYTFPAGTGTGAITESGLLDASAAGNLLAHQVFAAVNKGASDTLQITWTLS